MIHREMQGWSRDRKESILLNETQRDIVKMEGTPEGGGVEANDGLMKQFQGPTVH